MKPTLKTVTSILLCMLTLVTCKKDSSQQHGENENEHGDGVPDDIKSQ